jgi:hypothetical protein
MALPSTRRPNKAALAVATATLIGVFGAAPAAHADNESYIAYIKSHGQSLQLFSESPLIAAGHTACGHLRSGESPAEVERHVLANPTSTAPNEMIVEAAQHELCPDTL